MQVPRLRAGSGTLRETGRERRAREGERRERRGRRERRAREREIECVCLFVCDESLIVCQVMVYTREKDEPGVQAMEFNELGELAESYEH